MELSSTSCAWRHVGPVPDPATLLQETYQHGITLFVSKLTKDESKREWIHLRHSISEVLEMADRARRQYEDKADSKAFEWISKFSSRVQYYGIIMDTLSQHHPEYVSLVWGAIKFCFIGVLNQEELVAQLSKALAQVADALPRAAMKLILYPTENMKEAVASIYAHVVKFLMRVLDWYTESRLKHIYHAITQPFSLRYKDLVEEIQSCTIRVEDIAADAAQAEMRDMHIIIRELKKIAVEHQALTSAGFLDTNRRLCELQFSEILTFVSSTPLLQNPQCAFNYHLAMKNRRRLRNSSDLTAPHNHDQLQIWASRERSALIIIQGSFISRSVSRDLAVSTVEAIRATDIPVVWVLNSRIGEYNNACPSHVPSAIDVLKQIVFQVLQLNHTLLNERSAALNAACYKSATTEGEWFNLLGAVIAGLPQIYMVIDVEVVGVDSGNTCLWPEIFMNLFEALLARNVKAIVKVVLVSYRTQLSLDKASRPGVGSVLNLSGRRQVVKSGRVVKGKKPLRTGKRKTLNVLTGA